ncbi:helix-turn-helix domain-containing protein [Helicobacter acinonychis]|uniref:helix-turn-helix domain-containing protein n=1 Tax=Helicobacter acinonychis TaxID=212 RepID=UPI000CF0B203|nr:helix-turn-helix domain-containing protein [Helicobacter acinonychis]STP03272.1 DNA-binding protein [Helicobacter acinonychis]
MKNRIDTLMDKIDALLERQERMVALLETYLNPTPQVSSQLFKSVSQEVELASEIAQEDEEKRLCVLEYLSHVDITKNKQDPQLKKDCLEFIQKFNIPKPIIITALYNLKGIKPTKKEVSKQLQKLYVWEKRYLKGGIEALKDRRGRPFKRS